jgi:hypothetical protein
MIKRRLLLTIFTLLCSSSIYAQGINFDMDDDDLNIGGDIFSDFNEDLENSKILEDERFYKYGRFFSVQFSMGTTTYSGNRGKAYEDQPPSLGFGVNYFSDFHSSFGMGVEFSKHRMFLSGATVGYGDPTNPEQPVGFVEVDMVRAYMSYRHYIDTANLGTAVTYSNPYLTSRFEYWYQTNTFIDQSSIAEETGGGIGFAFGGGLEFPIKIKESYIGVEALWHTVNFPDKYTNKYAPLPGESFGYEDLTGDVYSFMVSYVLSW